jgi:hypothetical protein
MVTLINGELLKAGGKPLGFMNQLLYSSKYQSLFINDITSGNNLCGRASGDSAPCCTTGYYAATGWDPVTGLGSVNFKNLKIAALGQTPTTTAPTSAPVQLKYTVVVTGLSYSDYAASPSGYKNQLRYAFAVACGSTVTMANVAITGITGTRRSLLVSSSTVAYTVTTGTSSATITSNINNAMNSGVFTAALASGYALYGGSQSLSAASSGAVTVSAVTTPSAAPSLSAPSLSAPTKTSGGSSHRMTSLSGVGVAPMVVTCSVLVAHLFNW